MTAYLSPKFSVMPGGTKTYRDHFDEVFPHAQTLAGAWCKCGHSHGQHEKSGAPAACQACAPGECGGFREEDGK